MAETYTTNLGIEKPGIGEQAGSWGATVNLNYDMFDEAVCGYAEVTLDSGDTSDTTPYLLTITDGALSDARNMIIKAVDAGDIGGTGYIQFTNDDAEKIAWVTNGLNGSQSLVVFQGTYDAGARAYTIAAGQTALLRFSGSGAGSSTTTNIMTSAMIDALIATTGTFSGAVTALSYGGITEANLVDKSAAETITGAWDLGVITATSYDGIAAANLVDKSATETISGDWTFSGLFTSVGIDDNATGERFQIEDGYFFFGPTNNHSNFAHPANDKGANFFGGNLGNGGRISLYGASHSTNANDIEFGTGLIDVELQYDDSASTWDFQANAITTTGNITSGLNVSAANLIASSDVLASDYRQQSDSGVTRFSGDQGFTDGGMMYLYGGAHSSQANDVVFYGANSIELQYDHSASEWDFQANDIITTGDVVATGAFVNGGASGPQWLTGSGSPHGSVTAPIGSLYSRTDVGELWVNTNGSTNWSSCDLSTPV